MKANCIRVNGRGNGPVLRDAPSVCYNQVAEARCVVIAGSIA